MNSATLGAYRPLFDDGIKASQSANISLDQWLMMNGGTCLERYIRSLWTARREHRLSRADVQELFGTDNFSKQRYCESRHSSSPARDLDLLIGLMCETVDELVDHLFGEGDQRVLVGISLDLRLAFNGIETPHRRQHGLTVPRKERGTAPVEYDKLVAQRRRLFHLTETTFYK